MVVLWRAILMLLVLLGGGVGMALGQSAASSPKLTDPLPWRADQTYADLVQLVVSDGANTVRHIDSENFEDLKLTALGTPRIASAPLRSGGRDRVALLLDFGETEESATGVTILSLFERTGEPRLLDAAAVAFDLWTDFEEPVRLPVGVDDDLLLTRSTHSNSGQAYSTTALILAHGDRLELVARIATFDDRACVFDRTQRLEVQQGEGEPFADIVATVTERTVASGEECGDAVVPEPARRAITVTYQWDAAAQRYVPNSDAFEVLARENEARF